MGSHGIKDRIAIIGMGCTTFGEHWDKGAEELMVGAFEEALGSVDAQTAAALRELVRDASYVEPRVVSHLRD